MTRSLHFELGACASITYEKYDAFDPSDHRHPGSYVAAGPEKDPPVHKLGKRAIPDHLARSDIVVGHRLLGDYEALRSISREHGYISPVVHRRNIDNSVRVSDRRAAYSTLVSKLKEHCEATFRSD